MSTTGADTPLIGALLPEDVAASELFTDPVDLGLYPEERAALVGAVAARQREFATVRRCARVALARIGVPAQPILPDPEAPPWARRAPRWPEGIVGSMTHCEGYRAAAVARHTAIASVGVDAEPNAPLPEGVAAMTILPEEEADLARLAAADPSIAWDRLLFSAKESVFKAWYPLTGKWLEFHECVVVPDPDRGVFTATLTVPGPVVDGVRLEHFDGRWGGLRTDGARPAVVADGSGPTGDAAAGHLATTVVVRRLERP